VFADVAREITVLVNPTSGGGRGARLAGPVTERLKGAGLDARWEAGRDAAESAELARRAVARGVDALVVVGGDGMIHLALQAVAGTSTPLGVVPAGSGNDLARALSLPRKDPLAAVDLVIAGQHRPIDLGKAGGTWFGTIFTTGFTGRVTDRLEAMPRLRGPVKYAVGTALEVRDFKPRPYVLELDGERWETDVLVLAIGNTSSLGGGVWICEGADPADGTFDVTVVGNVSRLDLAKLYPKLFTGRSFSHPAITRRKAKLVNVAAPATHGYADGEKLAPLPLTVECVSEAVRMFLPPKP
jgi:diacylglycerol kinase (ATP)